MAAPWARGAEGRIVGEIHGQQTVNVLHFATNTVVSDGPDLNALLLQLAAAMLDCASTVLLDAVTQDWRVKFCDAKEIFPTPSDPVIATAGALETGNLGPTSVSFAASLVSIRTGQGQRRGRGRMFLPPPGEANIAASLIDNDTMTLIAAFLTCVAGKFLGASPSTDWRLGVLSRKDLTSTGGTFNNAFRIATQLSPVQTVACMRSRRIGHGA